MFGQARNFDHNRRIIITTCMRPNNWIQLLFSLKWLIKVQRRFQSKIGQSGEPARTLSAYTATARRDSRHRRMRCLSAAGFLVGDFYAFSVFLEYIPEVRPHKRRLQTKDLNI